MTLHDGKVGSTYKVADIELGIDEKRRLEILGLTHNSKVTILGAKKRGSGSMIIRVRGTRFAIGKNFALGIKTAPESAPAEEPMSAKEPASAKETEEKSLC